AFEWFVLFQAEDGIREFHVTGVQTCALPIYCAILMPAVGVPQARCLQRPTHRGLDRDGRGSRHQYRAMGTIAEHWRLCAHRHSKIGSASCRGSVEVRERMVGCYKQDKEHITK